MFHAGNYGHRFSCMEHEICHISWRKVWTQILLHEIYFPNFVQENVAVDVPVLNMKFSIFHAGKY